MSQTLCFSAMTTFLDFFVDFEDFSLPLSRDDLGKDDFFRFFVSCNGTADFQIKRSAFITETERSFHTLNSEFREYLKNATCVHFSVDIEPEGFGDDDFLWFDLCMKCGGKYVHTFAGPKPETCTCDDTRKCIIYLTLNTKFTLAEVLDPLEKELFPKGYNKYNPENRGYEYGHLLPHFPKRKPQSFFDYLQKLFIFFGCKF